MLALAKLFLCSTSTLHFRPKFWRVLGAAIVLSLVFTFSMWGYCSNPDNCLAGSGWDEDFWGPSSCKAGYCERCHMDQYIRSYANSYSNIAFVITAMVILSFGVEDYIFFNHGRSDDVPKDTDMDYSSKFPPNLILGGSGPVILLFVLVASGGLFWAGYGAFVFHAGMTEKGGKWDICSVYTLVWLSLPYATVNHFYCLKWKFPKTIIFIVSVSTVVLAFWYPFKFIFEESRDHNTLVPQFAGVNFLLLFSNYVVGYVSRQVRLRKFTDLWLIIVSAGLMYLAKESRDKDMEWCESPDAFFQGHAVWHSSMAIGVMFFYLFMRQERPWIERRGEEGGGEWMERVEEGKGGDYIKGRTSSSGSENLNLELSNNINNTML
ncbi:hypothetical protein TrST_g2251 [Triparma strigata]|uniref:Ceramidase n=1 Tax=Triparma strigata TaxID=1606541 RepID=A0A9W7AUY5_9STRA|nr:hypothetical protein TrST_g2251 [Triparma strigata]